MQSLYLTMLAHLQPRMNKCRVSYPDTQRIDFETPRASDNGVELVVYIDRDHYHRVEVRDTGDETSQTLDDPSVQPPDVENSGVDAPSDDEVMRVLEDISTMGKESPFLLEVKRDNVRIVKELVKEEVDEPRVHTLIGPAQLHHVCYKCTVTYTKTTRFVWPFAHTVVDENVKEVVYIDREYFHKFFNAETEESRE